MLIITLIVGVMIASSYFEGVNHVQWSDDVHGLVTDKRVDAYGDLKCLDYVLTMYNDGKYYESIVSFEKYARTNIGDQL